MRRDRVAERVAAQDLMRRLNSLVAIPAALFALFPACGDSSKRRASSSGGNGTTTGDDGSFKLTNAPAGSAVPVAL